jgi:dTDP-4-dehydrorhamnose reductase
MRTLIFGVQGQLGGDLLLVFEELGDVCGAARPPVDVCDAEAVLSLAKEYEPDVILNAAAYTDVEGAEDDAEEAFRVNEGGARNVAQAAAACGAPVVHYSTDYVFGGTKTTPYDVGDETAPIGVYARSKWAGEAAVRDATAKHYIVRTSWLYGPGGNNFVEKMIAAAQSRPELRVVDDEIGCPTHTWDVAVATRHLVQSGKFGTYHVCNSGQCSRYEQAREILRLAGIDTPVHPCKSSEFPTKAERPLYSVLSNAALVEATGYTPPDWRDALAAYMERRNRE